MHPGLKELLFAIFAGSMLMLFMIFMFVWLIIIPEGVSPIGAIKREYAWGLVVHFDIAASILAWIVFVSWNGLMVQIGRDFYSNQDNEPK